VSRRYEQLWCQFSVGGAGVVLTNREHIIALEARDKGLMGMLLRYPYEVRDASEYFDDIQDVKITNDRLDLAKHIVDQKSGQFEPEKFEDHYETALQDLLQNGQTIAKMTSRTSGNVIDIMDALRASEGQQERGDDETWQGTGQEGCKDQARGKTQGRSAPVRIIASKYGALGRRLCSVGASTETVRQKPTPVISSVGFIQARSRCPLVVLELRHRFQLILGRVVNRVVGIPIFIARPHRPVRAIGVGRRTIGSYGRLVRRRG
jgi:hypothetical protein